MAWPLLHVLLVWVCSLRVCSGCFNGNFSLPHRIICMVYSQSANKVCILLVLACIYDIVVISMHKYFDYAIVVPHMFCTTFNKHAKCFAFSILLLLISMVSQCRALDLRTSHLLFLHTFHQPHWLVSFSRYLYYLVFSRLFSTGSK